MPEIERDGEELPRLSPGVGCDSTAQGDNHSNQKRIMHCVLIIVMARTTFDLVFDIGSHK